MTRWLVLLAVCSGCAVPMKESLRPRGVDLYSETGRTDYGPRSKFNDWRIGANVHFDIYYEDEQEQE